MLVFFVVFFSGVLALAVEAFLPRVVFFAGVSAFTGLTIVTAFFVPLVFLAGVFFTGDGDFFTGDGDFSTALDFFVALVFFGVAFFAGDDFTGEGDFSTAFDFLAVLVFLAVDTAALTGVSAFLAGVALSAALPLVALAFLGGLAAASSTAAFTGEAVRFTGVLLAGAAALPRVALVFLAGVASLTGAASVGSVVLAGAAAALPRVALAFLGGETTFSSSLTGEGEALRFEVVFSGSDFPPRREVRLTGSSAAGGAISICSGSSVAFAGAAFFPPRPFLVLVMGFSGEAMAAGAALEAARAALPRCALTGLTGTSDSLMGSPRRNFVFIGFSFNEDFAA